jgi:hypothetical protein
MNIIDSFVSITTHAGSLIAPVLHEKSHCYLILHTLEPYYSWLKYYDSGTDEVSPFFGKQYNQDIYEDAIYNYFIDPNWDYIGSETLYIKLIYVDYPLGFAVVELIGEWNDAISNDVMYLKRNVVDHLAEHGIDKYILIGENVFNFHGSDDCYYEEWYEELDEGWIVALNFREFIWEEWNRYRLHTYMHCGPTWEMTDWRTLTPIDFCMKVSARMPLKIARLK